MKHTAAGLAIALLANTRALVQHPSPLPNQAGGHIGPVATPAITAKHLPEEAA